MRARNAARSLRKPAPKVVAEQAHVHTGDYCCPENIALALEADALDEAPQKAPRRPMRDVGPGCKHCVAVLVGSVFCHEPLCPKSRRKGR